MKNKTIAYSLYQYNRFFVNTPKEIKLFNKALNKLNKDILKHYYGFSRVCSLELYKSSEFWNRYLTETDIENLQQSIL